MKIGIMTFSRAINYGAVLQAFALQKTIQDCGVECDILDYARKPNNKEHGMAAMLKGAIIKLIQIPKRCRFRRFWRNMGYSRKYDSKTIIQANSFYDCFISGSDQVFNYKLTGDDYNYMLDFVSEPATRSSYAASFGLAAIDAAHKERYTELLDRFSLLSVREQQGRAIVEELTGRKCNVVLDPVFLLDAAEWNRLANRAPIRHRYILIYQFSSSDKLSSMVRQIAQNKKLDVVVISGSIHKSFGKAKYLMNCGPLDFLTLIKNADFIITNSFHGISFSIIFRKQFWVFVTNELSEVSSRIYDLLSLLKLQDRMVDGKTYTMQEIPYDEVDRTLCQEKERSKRFLMEVIHNNDTNR